MTFTSGEATLDFKAYPILLGDALDQAQNQYQQAMQDYQESLGAWKEEFANAKQAFLASISTTENPLEDLAEFDSHRSRVRSRFSVDQLGVWNCDRLIENQDQIVRPMIKEDALNLKARTVAYFALDGQNTLYRSYLGEEALFPESERGPSKLWVVDEKVEVALAKDLQENWGQMPNQDGSLALPFELLGTLGRDALREALLR